MKSELYRLLHYAVPAELARQTTCTQADTCIPRNPWHDAMEPAECVLAPGDLSATARGPIAGLTDKPNSVPLGGGGHLSGSGIAAALERPTRSLKSAR